MKPISALFLMLIALPATLRAEVFVLENGGRVVGECLNRDESPRQTYLVQVADGVKITLDAKSVKEILHPRNEEAEYERIAPTYADTVDAQWELSKWCNAQKLKAQREVHLRRIIELDPNHAEARHALGYYQVEGQWTKRSEVMTERGYVFRNGKYMLPQEIEIADAKKKQRAAQLEWCRKVKSWRGWIGRDREEQAIENIRAIEDPMAVEALAKGIHDEENPMVRKLFIAALARIDTTDAAAAMAYAAIYDMEDDVRQAAIDHLATKSRPEVVAYFVKRLRDADNQTVNLAAIGLGRMNDLSAVGPLIDALITVHKYKIGGSGGGGGNSIGASFGSGGAGMSVGSKPKILRKEIANQAVLDALVALTGKNFVFDKRAWKSWYAGQKKAPAKIDARRD